MAAPAASDWSVIPDRRAGGRPPVGLERMLQIYFLQQWYGLSDERLEDAHTTALRCVRSRVCPQYHSALTCISDLSADVAVLDRPMTTGPNVERDKPLHQIHDSNLPSRTCGTNRSIGSTTAHRPSRLIVCVLRYHLPTGPRGPPCRGRHPVLLQSGATPQ